MRHVTETEYATAKQALAIYREFSKPYVQKNGWTVIPVDAPYPVFAGESLRDKINAYSTAVELFELARDRPEKISAYVSGAGLTTWTGEKLGTIISRGDRHHNNFGGCWRAIRVRCDWGLNYYGREYDSHQLVNLRCCV